MRDRHVARLCRSCQSDGSRAEAERELADVAIDADVDARPPLAPADLDDLHDRLETAWRSWRQPLEHHKP